MDFQAWREYYKKWSRLESIVAQTARKYAAEHARYMLSNFSAEAHDQMLAAQAALLDAVDALREHMGAAAIISTAMGKAGQQRMESV